MAQSNPHQALPVQSVQTRVGNNRDYKQCDGAAIVALWLRSSLIRGGPPSARASDSAARPITTGRAMPFNVAVAGRKIPWDSIRPHLREALELGRPEKKRSAYARYLAEYLHAETPTLLQYILARPKLLQIWDALKHQMR
mgnify:CR=1 FL=1